MRLTPVGLLAPTLRRLGSVPSQLSLQGPSHIIGLSPGFYLYSYAYQFSDSPHALLLLGTVTYFDGPRRAIRTQLSSPRQCGDKNWCLPNTRRTRTCPCRVSLRHLRELLTSCSSTLTQVVWSALNASAK